MWNEVFLVLSDSRSDNNIAMSDNRKEKPKRESLRAVRHFWRKKKQKTECSIKAGLGMMGKEPIIDGTLHQNVKSAFVVLESCIPARHKTKKNSAVSKAL